jgi:hypothetical protein
MPAASYAACIMHTDVYEGRSVVVMKCLLVVAMATLLCTAANADLLTYTASAPMAQTDWTRALLLQKFDSSLGTLNSVTLTLNASMSQTLMYENLDGPGSITFEITGGQKTRCEYAVSFTGGSQLLADTILNTPTYLFEAFDGGFDFGGTSGATHVVGLSQSSGNVYTGVDMAAFVGTGVLDLSLTTGAHGASAWQATSGNIAVGVSTIAGAEVSVAYDYTAVPEPATIGLLSLGGLLLARRRR